MSGYDYTQAGAYFVTVCAAGRESLFGQIENGHMQLNESGRIVQATWEMLPDHYSHMRLDALVVMPNHIHGIVIIVETPTSTSAVGARFKPAPTRHALPEIVRALKTFSARRINEQRGTPGTPVWQRNYYEHVIRSDDNLLRIRQYIADNPARWAEDPENPQAVAAAGPSTRKRQPIA